MFPKRKIALRFLVKTCGIEMDFSFHSSLKNSVYNIRKIEDSLFN